MVKMQWQCTVFTHLSRWSVDSFERRQVGDIVSHFNSIHEIQWTVTTYAAQAFIDGLLAFTTVIAMLLYAPMPAAVSMATLAICAVLQTFSMRPLMAANQVTIDHGALQQTHFLETVRSARAIKRFDKADDRRVAWLNLLVAQTNASVIRDLLNIAFSESSRLLFGFERLIVVALAVLLLIDGRFTIGASY